MCCSCQCFSWCLGRWISNCGWVYTCYVRWAVMDLIRHNCRKVPLLSQSTSSSFAPQSKRESLVRAKCGLIKLLFNAPVSKEKSRKSEFSAINFHLFTLHYTQSIPPPQGTPPFYYLCFYARVALKILFINESKARPPGTVMRGMLPIHHILSLPPPQMDEHERIS